MHEKIMADHKLNLEYSMQESQAKSAPLRQEGAIKTINALAKRSNPLRQLVFHFMMTKGSTLQDDASQ